MDDAERDQYQSELRQLRSELQAACGGHRLVAVPKPPPLRQAEVLRALLAERSARASHQARASARLTQNSKGDTQIEVLAEANAETVAEAAAEAAAECQRVYDSLRLIYPPPGTVKPRSSERAANGSWDDA